MKLSNTLMIRIISILVFLCVNSNAILQFIFYDLCVGSVFDNLSTDVSARTSKRVSNASYMGVLPSTPPPSIISRELSVSTDNGQHPHTFIYHIVPYSRNFFTRKNFSPPALIGKIFVHKFFVVPVLMVLYKI